MAQVWKPTQFDNEGQPIAFGWQEEGPNPDAIMSFGDGSQGTALPAFGVDENGNTTYDISGYKTATGQAGGTPGSHQAYMSTLPQDTGGGFGDFLRNVMSTPIGMAIGAAGSGYLSNWLSGADSAFTGGVDLGGEQYASLGDTMSDIGYGGSDPTSFDFSGSNTPLADNYLNSAGNFGQGMDVPMGGQVFNTAGPLDPSTIGANAGGWSNDIMKTIQSGLGDINKFLGMDKNPITLGDIGKSGANFLISTLMANRAMQNAQQAGKMGSALDQGQRAPYQAQLQSLMSNPSTFYSTNPVVQAQLAEARKQFEAASAKMGTGGTQQNDYLKNLNNIFSGTFNDQAQQLAGLGGFNFGPGGSGAFGQLAGLGTALQNEAFRGFGQNLFKQQGPQQQQGMMGSGGLPGAATPA
jgi:hypothetical protein